VYDASATLLITYTLLLDKNLNIQDFSISSHPSIDNISTDCHLTVV